MDTDRKSIDLEFVFTEFENWSGKKKSSPDRFSSHRHNDEIKELVAAQAQLAELLQGVHRIRDLTYFPGKPFKWLNPLRRFLHRKKIDRGYCDLLEITASAIGHSLELTEARNRQFCNARDTSEKRISIVLDSVNALRAEVDQLEKTNVTLHAKTDQLQKTSGHLQSLSEKLSKLVEQLSECFDALRKRGSNALNDDNCKLLMADSFYERMRGESSSLKDKFKHRYEILEEILGEKLMGKSLRCLDLGCGRGEWLQVLFENGHEVLGVDDDERMSHVCRLKGLETRTGEVLESLKLMEESTFDVISMFHLAEHLDLNTICGVLEEVSRIGRNDAIFIIEVPNVHNPFLSSTNFYLDPTHRTKLPLELLEHLLETFGYQLVHARFLGRNEIHAGLLSDRLSCGNRDERFDHMELLIIGMTVPQEKKI